MKLRLYLFDDQRAESWEPFVLTRPAGALVLGAMRAWERAARIWKTPCAGLLAGSRLRGFHEDGGPAVLSADAPGTRDHRLLVSSRLIVRSAPLPLPSAPAELSVRGVRAGWSLPPGTPLPSPEALRNPCSAPSLPARLELDGFLMEDAWDLVSRGPAQLQQDLVAGVVTPSSSVSAPESGNATRFSRIRLPPGVHSAGKGTIVGGRDVIVEPGVVFDPRPGAVVLGDGVRVSGPARLEGPLYVGPNSTILGGFVSGSYIGPGCNVRGEVERSTLLGYDNKAHGGFLGHAYLGQWVNLGAFTSNSDLRNDYRHVRMQTGQGTVPTGRVKLGCLLGDHVKTAIGTLVNTGAVVGAGSNVFGAGEAVGYLPPFRWGGRADAPLYHRDRFLETAEHVMARRGVTLTQAMRQVLERAWLSTARPSR